VIGALGKKLGKAFCALSPSFSSSPNVMFWRENSYFFFATAFLAGAAFATTFFAGAFLAGAAFATTFFAGAFLAGAAFFTGMLIHLLVSA
jgi:hypothetical protein